MLSLAAQHESKHGLSPVECPLDIQRRIAEQFELLDDWSDRYQVLIEFGRRLPSMPPALKTERSRIQNCRGNTWLAGNIDGGILHLSAASDTDVIAGLLAVLVEMYSGRPARHVFDHPLAVLDTIGLTGRLSPHRLAAVGEITGRLKQLAAGANAGSNSATESHRDARF